MTQTLRNRRVLITGANGFIGGHLVAALNARGALISVIDRSPSSDTRCSMHFAGDLRDAAFVADAVNQANPEIIFHLAAFKERTSEIEAFAEAIAVNVMGSLNLFTAAKKLTALRSVVVIGTAEEYGRIPCPFTENSREQPINAYSFSKVCLTHLCHVLNDIYRLPFVVLRPTLAYGPGQHTDMFLPALIQSVLHDRPFPMTLGRQTRDFLYISDLVDALLRAAVAPSAVGQIINLGSGRSISLGDLARTIENTIGKTGIAQIGARPYRIGEVMEYQISIRKAAELLNWSAATSLEDGIRATIEYYSGMSS